MGKEEREIEPLQATQNLRAKTRENKAREIFRLFHIFPSEGRVCVLLSNLALRSAHNNNNNNRNKIIDKRCKSLPYHLINITAILCAYHT
jgi:hypothetical protein